MSSWGRDFAEEEVKKYVNRNLDKFHRVQFSQMIHLPCLTETDRQKIKATCTNEGNNETTFVFFQRLCCREGWVLPFVKALREQQMGNLATKLENLYRSYLLPQPSSPPSALVSPAANRPSAPPLQPAANEQTPLMFEQAIPTSRSRLVTSSASLPSQNTGDCRTPVQENSHSAEKSKLVVHPETTSSSSVRPCGPSEEASLTTAEAVRASGKASPSPVEAMQASGEASPTPIEAIRRGRPTHIEAVRLSRKATSTHVEAIQASGEAAQTADKAGEPAFSFPSGGSSASNVEAAVGGDRATASQDPYPVKESPSVPGPVEERPLSPLTTSTSAVGSVEQKWDGRQHRPVTVKNGCFGNMYRPEDSGTPSSLPTGASSNQPEEDYYSSEGFSLAFGSRRKDLAADRKQENLPVVHSLQSRLDALGKNLPAPRISAEDQRQLPFMDPSSRSSPANSVQLSVAPMETKSPVPVANPTPEHRIRLPSSNLSVSYSLKTKPCVDFTASGDDRSSEDFKLPVEEKGSLGQPPAGQPQQGTDTLPSAVGDHKRDNCIFHSNYSEYDIPSKPGILFAENTASLSSSDARETDNYSGTSERFCLSDSDPILVSVSSSLRNSPASTTPGENQASGPIDASLPPGGETGEEDTSVRSHHLYLKENPSMDLMGVPLDSASSRSSPRAFLDPASKKRPEEKAQCPAEPSLPDKTVKVGVAAPSGEFWLLFVGFVVASLAAAAFVLYKKK